MNERRVGNGRVGSASSDCVRIQGLLRTLATEKTAEECTELLHGGAPAPEPRSRRRRLLHGVDKKCCLAVLRSTGPPRQRYRRIKADVCEQAPEEAMRNIVKAVEPEKLLRSQQIDAEHALCDEHHRQPSGLRERRQEQRVQPHEKSGREPAGCA